MIDEVVEKKKVYYKHLAVDFKTHEYVVFKAKLNGMKVKDYVAELVRRQAHEDINESK
jgi:hypothetical protein